MPKIEIEISRTRRVEISETGIIEVDVPKDVIKSEEFDVWLEEKCKDDPEFTKKVDAVMETQDEFVEIDVEYVESLEG